MRDLDLISLVIISSMMLIKLKALWLRVTWKAPRFCATLATRSTCVGVMTKDLHGDELIIERKQIQWLLVI